MANSSTLFARECTLDEIKLGNSVCAAAVVHFISRVEADGSSGGKDPGHGLPHYNVDRPLPYIHSLYMFCRKNDDVQLQF